MTQIQTRSVAEWAPCPQFQHALGPVRIVSSLGEGRMGEVYQATDFHYAFVSTCARGASDEEAGDCQGSEPRVNMNAAAPERTSDSTTTVGSEDFV